MPQRAAAHRKVEEQHRQRDFVHLDAGPVGRPVQPHVLGPVAIGVLRDLQEAQDAPRVVLGAGRQETAGGLDEVAGPDEVIAAQVVIALVEAPGDREAGDYAAAKVLGFVDAQHGGAEVNQRMNSVRRCRRRSRTMPSIPIVQILRPGAVKASEEARQGVLTGRSGRCTKAQSEDELGRRPEVDLPRQRHVAVRRPLVRRLQPPVGPQHLPSIGEPDEARRASAPRRGAGQRQRVAVALREQHERTLVIADPRGIAIAAVVQVRSEQREQTIVRYVAPQRLEADALEDDVRGRIREYLLVNAIAAVGGGVAHAKRGNARRKQRHLRARVAFLLGEVRLAVGDDQAEIARARRVDAGIVDFVEDPVAQCEPHVARRAERGADAALRAGGPSRGNPRPAWRGRKGDVGHGRSDMCDRATGSGDGLQATGSRVQAPAAPASGSEQYPKPVV